MRARDPPAVVLVAQMVRVVGEAHAVEHLEPIQVVVEAVGEHAERDLVLAAPGDQLIRAGIELDRPQEGLELGLRQRQAVEDLEVVVPRP